MNQIILAKCGELVLKGLNKSTFIAALVKDLKEKLAKIGELKVSLHQSTVYIKPLNESADIDKALQATLRTFGIAAAAIAHVFEKDLEKILQNAPKALKNLENARTFKVEAKRADKNFAVKSPEICARLGEAILNEYSHLKVDVKNPDVIVTCEIRENNAFVRCNQIAGAGGLPKNTAGVGVGLLSGGIDSPVALWMMARRGMRLVAVHFSSPPYTSKRAENKVLDLAKQLAKYTTEIHIIIVPITEIQEQIGDNIKQDLSTLIQRRFMLAISEKIGEKYGAKAIVTGENLGQVASQTLAALNVTDQVANNPIFRPLIGLDKEEITRYSRRIDTFNTSILPYEDCCGIFTPKHPKTRPTIEEILHEESKLNCENLIKNAIELAEYHTITTD